MLHLLSSVGGVLAVCALIGIVASGYVKSPPNVAYIISGFRKEPRVLIGRAGISQVSNNVPVVMQQVFETVKETTGLDLKDVVLANSKTAKTDRNITVKTDLLLKEAVSDKEEDNNTATKVEAENVQNKNILLNRKPQS